MPRTPPREAPPVVRWWVILPAVAACVLAAAILWRFQFVGTRDWTLDAQRAIEQHDFAQAKEILRQQHNRAPNDYSVVQVLAEVCEIEGKHVEAIDWLNRIPDAAGQAAARARLDAALHAMQLSRFSQAHQLLARAIQIDPAGADARRVLATFESNFFRPQHARRQYIELDRHGRATAEDVCLFCAGDRLRYDADKNAEMLAGFHRVEPDNAVVASALAQNYIRVDKRDNAVALLSEAIESSTDAERWLLFLGLAEHQVDIGDHEQAAENLARLPIEADALPRTWLARGRVRRERGQSAAAVQAFENAQILDPFDPEPAYALSRILDQQGDVQQAAALLERARQLQRLSVLLDDALHRDEAATPQKILQIGRLLASIGARREALICFRQLVVDGGDFTSAANEELVRMARSAEPIPDLLQMAAIGDLNGVTIAKSADSSPASLAGDLSQNDRSGGVARIALRDVAESAQLDFAYANGDAGQKLLLTSLGGGAAVLDYDVDGWPDLFFPQGGPLPPDVERTPPDKMLRNLGLGAFADVSQAALIHAGGYGHGAAVGDVDNDGFADLLVCNYGGNTLYRNNGDGTFADITAECGIEGDAWSTGAAFGDFDLDGDLDLYVVNYVQAPFEQMKPCYEGGSFAPCRPFDYPAEQDRLWENDGAGGFLDRTEQARMVAAEGKGLGVVVADFDDDQRPDIFVGNDTTGNFLFHNVSEVGPVARLSFREVGGVSGVAYNDQGLPEACMGIACGDVDDDGLLDLLVTNFEDETNTFYHGKGDLQFADETAVFRLADSSRNMLGWGAQFVDFDGDSRLDLFVGNGHLHAEPMKPQVYVSEAGKRFRELAPRAGDDLAKQRMSRGAAVVDWNNDLRPDLVVTDLTAPAALLQNDSQGGAFASLALIGTAANRDATGARVVVQIGERTLYRQVMGGSGYMAANQRALFVGAAGAAKIDRLEVHWPGGRVELWADLATGAAHTLVEGRGGADE